MIIKSYSNPKGDYITLTVNFDKYHFPESYTLYCNGGTAVTYEGTKENAELVSDIFDRCVSDFEKELAR